MPALRTAVESLAAAIGSEIKARTPKTYVLAADFPSTVTARATVTGWSHPMVAGGRYCVQVIANFTGAAITTGGSMGLVLSAGAATMMGSARAGLSNISTGAATEVSTTLHFISTVNTASGSFLTSPSVIAVFSPHYFTLEAVVACQTAGNLLCQWGSEVAASEARLLAGACLIVTKLP
jgi:hypothetical protein